MKKLLIVTIVLFAGTVFAQETEVPTVVKAKFQELYPKAEEVNWDVEGSNFEVSFESEEDVDISLLFDGNGNILETETEVEKKDLPAAVKESLEKDFSDWEITELAKIVSDGKTIYEAELEKGEKQIDAILSPDGKLVKKTSKDDDDEDGEKGEKKEEDEK